MIIGSFFTAPDGFVGRLQSLTLDAILNIVPAQASEAEKAPDWRVVMTRGDTDIEVGAGWNHTGKRAGDYISLQIDDPQFARPLRANLVRSGQDESFILLWSRPAARSKTQSS